MKFQRAKLFELSGSRTGRCEFLGCEFTTRENKPFCPKHVDQMPYVQKILENLADKAEELDILAKSGRVNEHSKYFREILVHIRNNGTRTVERLGRELSLDVEIIKKLVNAMKQQKLIRTGKTSRGSTTVSLP